MNNVLKKGDSVIIISPSATTVDNLEAETLMAQGEEILTRIGLKVVYGKNAKKKDYYKAGVMKQRLADFEDAYKDPKIKAIFCSQGGDNSNELLPYINWDVVKRNPKKFFGFSDITVLLNSIYSQTKQISYHGIDLMWGLGKNATEYTEKNLEKLLFHNELIYKPHKDYPNWKSIKKGFSKGTCLGGCLPSFCLLLGTDNDPIRSTSGPFILIIESIGESFSRIESYIAQIFQQPNFKEKCSGIIIGNFFLCKEEIPENNRNVSDIVLDYAKDCNFPIIEVKEFGHGVENMIFPIGGEVSIKATDTQVTIQSA